MLTAFLQNTRTFQKQFRSCADAGQALELLFRALLPQVMRAEGKCLVRELFQLIDTDKSGYIEVSEFEVVVFSLFC